MIEWFEIRDRIDISHLPVSTKEGLIAMSRDRIRERVASALTDVIMSTSNISTNLIEVNCRVIIADEQSLEEEIGRRVSRVSRRFI